MATLVLILAGIILIAYSFFTAWTYFSLKKLVSALKDSKSLEKSLVEHISYTRSSLNVIV